MTFPINNINTKPARFANIKDGKVFSSEQDIHKPGNNQVQNVYVQDPFGTSSSVRGFNYRAYYPNINYAKKA